MENKPDHLLVLVHGMLASPSDWTYFQAVLKRRLGCKFLIYASSCNMYTKTFTGIEGAGKRLADEVMEVVKKTENLKKISFLAHSLGGLFARYAIAVLYTPNASSNYSEYLSGSSSTKFKSLSSSNRGLIAGLEAIYFITLATPHLGVRGNKQLPLLLGVSFLEKLVAPIAPVFTGLTGSQLFLTDGKPSKPPLLLRMASDCEEGKFISALGAFRCRVLYANIWLGGEHRPFGEKMSFPSLLLGPWMATNTWLMWSIAPQFCQRLPISHQKQPKQRRLHRTNPTYETQ
ncbi:hypothetical protein ACS0TY_017868 [Phlomoides rotata]